MGDYRNPVRIFARTRTLPFPLELPFINFCVSTAVPTSVWNLKIPHNTVQNLQSFALLFSLSLLPFPIHRTSGDMHFRTRGMIGGAAATLTLNAKRFGKGARQEKGPQLATTRMGIAEPLVDLGRANSGHCSHICDR